MRATLIAILLIYAGTAIAQNPPTVSMTLERDSLQIGEQTNLQLEVIYKVDEGSKPAWPQIGKTIAPQVEVLSTSDIDTLAVDADEDPLLFQQTMQVVITSFDTGHFVIEPVWFGFGIDSIKTNPLLLSVYAPTVNLLGDIKPIRPALPVEYSITHWLKANWPWILIGVILGIAIFLVIRYLKRKPVQIQAAPAEVKVEDPAHVIALRKLEVLRNDGLWQKGMVKQYYVRLSDILREYLESRYKILALEETTPEIIDELRGRHLDSALVSRAQKILNLADMVKFAKAKPMPADNENCFTGCKEFIELSAQPETVELAT